MQRDWRIKGEGTDTVIYTEDTDNRREGWGRAGQGRAETRRHRHNTREEAAGQTREEQGGAGRRSTTHVVERDGGRDGDGAVSVEVGEGEGELELGQRDVGVAGGVVVGMDVGESVRRVHLGV